MSWCRTTLTYCARWALQKLPQHPLYQLCPLMPGAAHLIL